MEINSLPKSNITPVKPSLNPDPVVKADANVVKATPKPTEKKVEAVKPTTKADITDVKPTGEVTTEGEPTFTLKVNGKEVKATQSEIIALAQKAKGADAALKEKAEIEKLAQNMLTNFDNDAYGMLVQRHGAVKAKEIAIKMVQNLIAEEATDPKDVEIERLKKFETDANASAEKTKKEQEAVKKAADQKVLYTKILTEIDTELNNTILPKDKLTLTRVLTFLGAGKKANGQAWTVKDAVLAVEAEDLGHSSYYAKQYVEGKLPSEKFKSIFGEEAFKKLNKEQIDTLKKADKVAKVEAKVEAAEEAPKRKTLSKNKGSDGVSEREWRKNHGSMGGL